jgi:hypothetical protein
LRWVNSPNLPQNPVSAVAVSERAGDVIQALETMKITVLKVPGDPRFSAPVSSHADMQCHFLSGGKGFCTNELLQRRFAAAGIFLLQTNVYDFSQYPQDCSLNAARIGHLIFANPKCLCPELKQAYQKQGLHLIPVQQGYAKCSIVPVNEDAAITEDSGIADAVQSAGIDVLRLRPGAVALQGYPYGFIGGTCGKIAKNKLAFAGCIMRHPEARQILSFLQKHHVQAVSLIDGPLQDIGGILPLTEKEQATEEPSERKEKFAIRNYTK